MIVMKVIVIVILMMDMIVISADISTSNPGLLILKEREFKARQALDFETFHREKTEERTRKIFEMEMGFLEIRHNLLRSM